MQGQTFRFNDRLPEVRQDARVEVLAGRGLVHIVAQPRLENQYTLAVAIEDRQPGSAPYSIALYWDASPRFFERGSGKMEKITWSGRVDEEALIECRGAACSATVPRGQPVSAERFKFSRPLPNREVRLRLDESHGRGQVRLVEQPSERNNYTARVSIRDPQGGAGEYEFALVWTRSSGKEPEQEAAGQGMIWSGLVDGRVRVAVQGRSALSETVQGRPVTGERADFLRALPARSDLHPALKLRSGRGRAEIVEFPSEKNNYRLVFEVTDPGGGDQYEIEVDW